MMGERFVGGKVELADSAVAAEVCLPGVSVNAGG